ncbi:MAG: Rpn family recombination-promoting nuclease/putative transposase [Desulfococcaceae bacterium]|jgi:hypothetical protein|nr:Rpn family recombination-promoting nuclease/putative transposase [Desulfococcaceae bacterium]
MLKNTTGKQEQTMGELQEIFEKSVNNPHDAAFKSAFKKLAVARVFFESYLPERIRRNIDFDSLEITDGSYVDEKLRDRHSDIVYKTKLKGADALLYILFEHQSTPDPMMVFRLLCYMVNIWKEWLDQNPGAKCLPLIFPAVLYHGRQKWNAPRTMGGMVRGSDEFSEYTPDFIYELYDLGEYPDEMLIPGGNTVLGTVLGTVLYLFKHMHDGEDFGRAFGRVTDLLREIRMRDESVFLHFLEWVLRYTYHARTEDESTVRGYIDRGMEKLGDENARRMAMTVAEQIERRGERRGEMKGASFLLHSMLLERFGTVSPELETKLRNADTDMLNRFGTSLFGFRKIHDAEKWWDDYGKEGNA